MCDNLKDIRQDIFDIETVPKVLYVYRGDTFEVVLDLTISASELSRVVLNCDGLPEALPLTLLESTDTSSKWNLMLTKELTLILAPKNHNFTITIVRTDGTELTLYKGIMTVNNRVYSNYSNNYYIAALLKQRAPTIADNDYLIGTMWVNVLTNRVYFLTSVVNDEANWLDYSDDKISEELTAEKVKQLYELNSDTNAFTDAEKAKLAGIEPGAEVNTVNSEDLVADNISFDGRGTNFLVGEADVEGAIKELDARVKTNADNVALKVSTSDIVDNLTSADVDKPLSANQGKVLKDIVDLLDSKVDDLELEAARLDNEIIRVEQELDAHIVDTDNPHGVTAEQVDTYVKATIDSKDASTLQEAKDFTYSRIDIDSKDAAVLAEAKEYTDDRISEEMTAEKVKQLYEANPDTNAFTDLEKAKLSGIAAGAEVNVQSDWNQTDDTQDDYIKNKPAIPTKVSQLENDSEFITKEDLPPQYDDTDLKSRLSAIEEIIESIDGETDADNVINKLHEIVALLDGYAEGTTLVNLLSGKADTNHNHDSVYVKQVEGKTLTDNNLTDALKSNYDTAYSHSQTAHAPSNAQANVIETVKVNGVALPVSSKAVDITIPETDLSNYYNKTETENIINDAILGLLGGES